MFYLDQVLFISQTCFFLPSTPENKSRVVNLSSAGSIVGVLLFGSGLDFATFKDSPHRRKYSTYDLYCQSKFVRVAITSVEPPIKLRLFCLRGECGLRPGIGPAPWG